MRWNAATDHNQAEIVDAPECDPWDESNLVWHYTNMVGAVGIFKTGAIKCYEIRLRESKHPIIWFSGQTKWEPTASRIVTLDVPHFRFGARRAMMTPWPALAKDAVMRWANRKYLEKSGRSKGANPSMWCGVVSMYYDLGSLLPQIETSSGWQSVDLADYVQRIDEMFEFKKDPIFTAKGQLRATRVMVIPRSAA